MIAVARQESGLYLSWVNQATGRWLQKQQSHQQLYKAATTTSQPTPNKPNKQTTHTHLHKQKQTIL